MVDVSIPFRGDPDAFQLAPSRKALIGDDIRIESDHLVYSAPLDALQENRLNQFVLQVQETLDTLRAEQEAFTVSALGRLHAAAAARKAKLEAESARAASFSFLIE